MLAAMRPASSAVCLTCTLFCTLRVRVTGKSPLLLPMTNWLILLLGTPPMYLRRVYACPLTCLYIDAGFLTMIPPGVSLNGASSLREPADIRSSYKGFRASRALGPARAHACATILRHPPLEFRMRRLEFRVVGPDGDGGRVPPEVGDRVVGDVQRLLSDVGELMVRRELRTQSWLPEDMVSRFVMRSGEGSGPKRGDETLLDDALALTCDELDRVALYRIHPEPSPSRIEAEGRRRIAEDVLRLADDLGGYSLYYGTGDRMRKFRMNARESLEEMVSEGCSGPVAVIGVVAKDPVHPGRMTITNGYETVPISFREDAPREAFPSYLRLGPVVACGRVAVDSEGKMTSMTDVPECLPFPRVVFGRIITPTKDVVLLNPVVAFPGYDREKGLWTLCQEDLGIEVAKPTWDQAVVAFLDYVAFLWETYVESEGPFEGEDREVHEFLSSLAYPRARPSQRFIMSAQSFGGHHGQEEAHIGRRRRRDRRGAHLQADRPGPRGRPPGQARPGPPLRGPREEDSRQVPRQDAAGLPLLQGLPRAADARPDLQGQGRGARGAHDLPVLRKGPAHAVPEGAVT